MALQAGASLITGARAERLLIEGGRVVGVAASATQAHPGGSHGARFTVRARAVMVACGSLMTPVLLMGDPATRRALGRSRMLGENLTIHPAAAVLAMHHEPVRAFAGIPQGYAIEEFHQEGLLMEGIFFPLDLLAASLTLIGPEYMHVLGAYDRLSCFGFVVEDCGRGSVRPGPGGRPLISYNVHDNDLARLRRGIDIISRVYLAAGVEAVYTGVRGHEVVRRPQDLTALRRASLRARDLELTAYHPLGTVRMGTDPTRSVVGPDLQAHDLPGLYVCDGSVLPTSPAVNPQLTIMAVARRGARALAEKLSP
jgi:choline dehydrogenase-like flavoprotein